MAEQVIEPTVNVNRKSVHHFDESKEDIDGNEVNTLFGHYDSDSDSLSSLSVVDDKNMKDEIEQLKSEIQEKANIIANLTLRYDLGILPSNNHTETNISADILAQHAAKLNSQTAAENFELRDIVNELRDENFHLRNEIYELQDKINRQVLQINKLEKDLREQSFESEQQEIKEDNVPLSDLSDLFEPSEPNVNDYILPDSLFDHLSPEPPTFEQELADGYDPFPLRDSTKILMQTITPGDRATFAEPFAEVDVQYQGFRFVDDRWQKFTTAAVDETVFVTQLGRHQNVIGLEQAILSMSKGEVCRVFVPSRLGYGEHGAEGLIPSNTDILFELTLVDVRNDVRTIDMNIDDGLEEKVEEKSTEDTEEENKCAQIQSSYKAQFVSNFFNFFSYLCLAYEYYSEVVYDYIVNNGFELHLVGIGRPKGYKISEIKLFDHINTENTMISVKTPMKAIHSVKRLKKFIKDIYGIKDKDLLILFSHVPLTNDRATLGEIGISNKSLLTLAICNEEKLKLSADPVVVEPIVFSEPVGSVHELFADSDAESDDDSSEDEQILYADSDEDESSEYESSVNNGNAVNALFEMYEDYESEYETGFVANQFLCVENGKVAKEKKQKVVEEVKEVIVEEKKEEKWPQFGFDVITQCSDVLVHKMPNCGHKMNRESLLEYALSAFADSKTTKLKCPHSIDENNTLCNCEWDYTEILNILQYGDDDKEDWTKYAKLELLASRNMIENELECQKCPSCHSLYFRNYRENKRALDDISTVKDVENEFKFECIFCPPNTETIVERIEIKNKFVNVALHFEDDVEEDIDGDAVNSLFRQDDDESDNDSSDDDDDSDSDDEEDGQRAIRFIEHMFDDDETEYEEKVTIKMDNQFCFCCGDKWSDKHVCDSSFKKDLVAILEDAPKKQIDSVENVPSIRSCPSCAQLIFHTEACKHMNCSACHTDFCFVCLKPKKNGRWQCGSYSDACPVADTQTEESLPDTIVITKKAFQLF